MMKEQNGQKKADFNQRRVLFYYQPNEYQIILAEKALLEEPAGYPYEGEEGCEEEGDGSKEANRPAAGTWKESMWILAGALILYVGFGIAYPGFASSSNFFYILKDILLMTYLAFGTMLVFLLGEIDLSTGSVIAASGCICAGMVERAGVPVYAGMLIGIACGSLLGALNGYVVSSTGTPSYIVTLFTTQLGTGIAYFYIKETPIESMIERISGTDVVFLLFPAVFVALAISFLISGRTGFGRYIYAAGRDKTFAGLRGRITKRVTLCVFAWSGFLASLTGVMMLVAGYYPHVNMGVKAQMDAVTAVILGGTGLKGGKGSIYGTLAGVVFVSILDTGIGFLGIDFNWGYVVQTGLVLAAIYIDFLRTRKLSQEAGR